MPLSTDITNAVASLTENTAAVNTFVEGDSSTDVNTPEGNTYPSLAKVAESARGVFTGWDRYATSVTALKAVDVNDPAGDASEPAFSVGYSYQLTGYNSGSYQGGGPVSLVEASTIVSIFGSFSAASPFINGLVFEANDGMATAYSGAKLWWLRDNWQEITPEKFGAVGNGVADDTISIKAAADTAILLETIVSFGPYTYGLSSQGSFPSFYTTSGAAGSGAGADDYIFYFNGSTDKVVWRGVPDSTRLKPIAADSEDYTLFCENTDVLDVDGIIWDGNRTDNGRCGPIYAAGVNFVNTGKANLFFDTGAMRIGSSQTRLTGFWTWTLMRFDTIWGTFCAGGKPGGFEVMQGGDVYIKTARGGINVEAEDENSAGLTHVIKSASIGNIYADDLDGDRSGNSGTSDCVVVRVADGCELLHVQSIHANLLRSASTARAVALSVRAGQDDTGNGSIVVDNIDVSDARGGAVYLGTGTTRTTKKVHVKSVVAEDCYYILDCQGDNINPAADQLPFELVQFDSVVAKNIVAPLAPNEGFLFRINNGDAANPDLIEKLTIGSCYCDTVRTNGLAIRNLGSLNIDDWQVDQSQIVFSGSFALDASNFVICKNARVESFKVQDMPTTGLEIETSESCTIIDPIIKDATGTGLYFDGDGDVTVRGGVIGDGGSGNQTFGLNFRATMTAEVSILDVDIRNNVTGPVTNLGNAGRIITRNIRGWLHGTGSLSPGTLAAGARYTLNIPIANSVFGQSEVVVSIPYSLQGCALRAEAKNNSVDLLIVNDTGSDKTFSTENVDVEVRRI